MPGLSHRSFNDEVIAACAHARTLRVNDLTLLLERLHDGNPDVAGNPRFAVRLAQCLRFYWSTEFSAHHLEAIDAFVSTHLSESASSS